MAYLMLKNIYQSFFFDLDYLLQFPLDIVIEFHLFPKFSWVELVRFVLSLLVLFLFSTLLFLFSFFFIPFAIIILIFFWLVLLCGLKLNVDVDHIISENEVLVATLDPRRLRLVLNLAYFQTIKNISWVYFGRVLSEDLFGIGHRIAKLCFL